MDIITKKILGTVSKLEVIPSVEELLQLGLEKLSNKDTTSVFDHLCTIDLLLAGFDGPIVDIIDEYSLQLIEHNDNEDFDSFNLTYRQMFRDARLAIQLETSTDIEA